MELSRKSQRPRCPVGEGEICPPWGDTPKARLLNCIGFQRGICWIPPVYKSNRREGSICISAFSYRLSTNGEKRSAFVGSDFPNWVKLILDWPRLHGLLQWHGPACQSWQGFHQICLFSAALDTWSDSYPNLSCLRWSESARTISRKSCTLCTFPFTHFISTSSPRELRVKLIFCHPNSILHKYLGGYYLFKNRRHDEVPLIYEFLCQLASSQPCSINNSK